LPNHFEYSNGASYGPVSADAQVLSGLQIAKLPPYSFFSLQPYNANEKIPGANVSGEGVPPDGTYLYAFGQGGLYAYSYYLSTPPPPSLPPPLPPPPPPGPLQIPPLVVGGTSLFTILGPGSANGRPLTLPTVPGPYSNTLHGLDIPSGSTLTITSKIGTLTS